MGRCRAMPGGGRCVGPSSLHGIGDGVGRCDVDARRMHRRVVLVPAASVMSGGGFRDEVGLAGPDLCVPLDGMRRAVGVRMTLWAGRGDDDVCPVGTCRFWAMAARKYMNECGQQQGEDRSGR